MHRLRQGDPWVRNLLFNSLIKSHITYGLSAWGPTITKTQFNKLNTIIKSGIRCVAGVPKKSHTGTFMKKYNQLYLDDALTLKICSEYLTVTDKKIGTMGW